jgi:hypothetical protein
MLRRVCATVKVVVTSVIVMHHKEEAQSLNANHGKVNLSRLTNLQSSPAGLTQLRRNVVQRSNASVTRRALCDPLQQKP